MDEGNGGPQFHGSWLSDKAAPLPGTPRTPQGRLFTPTGRYTGDPMRLSPSNWMKQPAEGETAAHDDIVSFHSSESSQLPRYDDPDSRQIDPAEHEGVDWDNEQYDENMEENEDYTDFSVDEKDRPMANYGSAVGMHFGDVKAAVDRDKDRIRENIHPVRIPGETVTPPPRGNFSTERPGGSIAAGPMRSNVRIVNAETGEMKEDTRWADPAANFATKATDIVEKGGTLAYRNDVESAGSTSYRALPETVRTWSEDVLGATSPRTGRPATAGEHPDTEHGFRNEPHPALVHLAQQGYNPLIRRSARGQDPGGVQPELPLEPQGLNDHVRKAVLEESTSRFKTFHEGRTWAMDKPKEQDRW